jgi:hypothetical protein
MSLESSSLLRLHVVAEADPGALARVVERFQNLNLVPRRVLAEMGSNDLLRVEVDIFGASERELSLIAGKIREVPSIVNAYWHRL